MPTNKEIVERAAYATALAIGWRGDQNEMIAYGLTRLRQALAAYDAMDDGHVRDAGHRLRAGLDALAADKARRK